jgi:hypothetical protein
MKNANQIITLLQKKPQFSQLSESQCIAKLKSALLVSIQRNIKYAYIKKEVLYIVLVSKLDKLDSDNIINTIKMILNTPQLQDLTCKGITINDVKVYADPKPIRKFTPYTTKSHLLHYKERATGKIDIALKDEKLNTIFHEIQTILSKNEFSSKV